MTFSWMQFREGESSHAVERGTNFTICGHSARDGRRVRKVKKCKMCLKLISKQFASGAPSGAASTPPCPSELRSEALIPNEASQ